MGVLLVKKVATGVARMMEKISQSAGHMAAVLALLCVQAVFPVASAATLSGVEFSKLPDGSVQVQLEFTDGAVTPTAFTISNPARLVLDFPGVNSTLERVTPINIGNAQRMRAVQSADRTRVVFDLEHLVNYQTTQDGSGVYVTLGGDKTQVAATVEAGAAAVDGNRIEAIDFRRTSDGIGQIVVSLSNPAVGIDTRKETGMVVAEFLDTSIAEELARKLDVTDFSTPVSEVEILKGEGKVRLNIAAHGNFEHVAYQTGDIYTIEVKEIKEEASELDKRRKQGYTGARISLNFQDIQVRAVLQLLADIAGKNLVASDTVGGNVTLRLEDVPWDQALDIVLSTRGLGKREEGNVMWVAPAAELAERERQQLEAMQQLQELAPLYTEYMGINFAQATDIAALLSGQEGNRLLTERGHVSIDVRTNTLIVNDTEEKLAEVRELVKILDIPIRQVLIESRIVNASTDFSKNLGVRFGTAKAELEGSRTNIVSTATLEGTTDVINGDTLELADRTNVDLAAGGLNGKSASSVALAIAKLPFGHLLELELSALEAEGRGEVLSNPRVVTSNQQEALIEQGTEIAYQEASSSGATSTAFKKAVLSLKVTPQITPDDHIVMDLSVTKDSVGNLVGGVPTIDTQQVNTQVLVDNGETLVIGGIYEENKNDSVTRTPFLGELPYVGFLFRTKSIVSDKTELLIFVTPKILQQGSELL